ncbi:hypothetical protein ACFXPS_45165, partial [Nocardia sp. NPDC059091]|uniref:hypothetical protein n=1 Tax=Nocardia sp. NPDC059091 TaxID=3346724 RepID=UPI0036B5C595
VSHVISQLGPRAESQRGFPVISITVELTIKIQKYRFFLFSYDDDMNRGPRGRSAMITPGLISRVRQP